jgi:ABC-2 type transport system permease protein
MRGIAPFVVGALFFRLRLPHDPVTWLIFPLSAALAVTVSFALRFMVNLSAFWFVDVRGIHALAASAWTLLSGFTIPIAFFPDGIREVVHVLPFVAMLELPVNVFLERATGVELVATLASQAGWAVVLLLAGRVLLAVASRKLVVQGG